MKSDLILIANSRVARLFTRASADEPLVPLAALEQPDAHLKASDAGDDRPGHGSSDNCPGGVTFNPKLDPQRKADLKFAHVVASRLDEALASGDCGRLVLFASNPFLGELKGALSEAAAKHTSSSINLDLTSFGLDEIDRRVASALAATHAPGRGA